MKVTRTTIKGKTAKTAELSMEKAVAEVLVGHPKNTSAQVEAALKRGIKLQGSQGNFYQIPGGYKGENGEYKDSESKKKRKEKGGIVKPETDENTITPEGLAEQCNTTAFDVRKVVRSLKLKRAGKYWSWNRVEDAETIAKITAALKKVAEKPVLKPKLKKDEPELKAEVSSAPDDLEEEVEDEEEE